MQREGEIATELIYKAINELREELAHLDNVIEQVEALAEDPPRRVRPRKSGPAGVAVRGKGGHESN